MIYVDEIGVGGQRIRIRDVRNGKTVDRVVDFATWKATIGPGGAITFRDMCNPDRYITSNIDNLIIDGEPAPADDEVEVSKRLWFISSLTVGFERKTPMNPDNDRPHYDYPFWDIGEPPIEEPAEEPNEEPE